MGDTENNTGKNQKKKGDRTTFWLGLLLAIPLSILANLLTTPVQNAIARYNDERARQRVVQLQAEYKRIELLYGNRSDFHEYLLSVIINTAFVTSLTASMSYLLFMSVGVLHRLGPKTLRLKRLLDVLRELFQGLGFAVLLVGSLLVVNISKEALRTYYNVRNFDSYKQSVPK